MSQPAEQAYRATLATLRKARLVYGHGTRNAADEAAYLVCHVLRITPGTLPEHRGKILSAAQQRRLEKLVQRRIAERIPVAYLTHEAWLGEYSFYVDRRVIVPRSHIAELLRDRLRPWLPRPPARILDLCTGSGCLAILAAHAFPRAHVDAADLSRAAIAVARRNIARHGLEKRIRLHQGDLFAPLDGNRYDLILCNPPYVTARAMQRLPAEYRREPALALDGGQDGLSIVRRILEIYCNYMTNKSILVCEIGARRRAVECAFPALPFTWLETSAGSNEVFLIEHAGLPRE